MGDFEGLSALDSQNVKTLSLHDRYFAYIHYQKNNYFKTNRFKQNRVLNLPNLVLYIAKLDIL